jgi:hypothetical protein
MKNYFINGVLFLALLLTACGRQYRLTEHNYYGYQVYKGLHASETAEQLITPYRDSLRTTGGDTGKFLCRCLPGDCRILHC